MANKPNKPAQDPKVNEAGRNQPGAQHPEQETPPREPGQDPNPEVEPGEHDSAETPAATATPPQRVQHEKSNQGKDPSLAAVEPEEDPLDTGKRYRVRVLKGIHSEGGKTYSPGDIVNSKTDLVGRFGTEKFASAE